MGSNFSCIGFHVENMDDFRRLVALALENGSDCLSGPEARYRKWSPGGGPEIWCRVDSRNVFNGLSPHFASVAPCKVGIVGRYPRRTEMLNGGYRGWIGASDGDPESGEYQVVFDVPGFDMYPDLILPATYVVNLAGFVQKMTVFPDESAFHAAGLPGSFPAMNIQRAVESFLPVGMFGQKEGQDPAAYSDLSGRVLAWRRKVNPATGMNFTWAKVKIAGMDLEVVGDPEDIRGELAVGAIVRGIFWLTGTLVRPGDRMNSREGGPA